MNDITDFARQIFYNSSFKFSESAIEIRNYQYLNNTVFRTFLNHLQLNPSNSNAITDIPFLPIEFFKSHKVITGNFTPETTFFSSGTTSSERSGHLVRDLSLYDISLIEGFKYFYGKPENKAILALLPTYLENPNASLVYMVNQWIQESQYPESGFFLNEYTELRDTIQNLQERSAPVILIGVSYALLALAENHPMDLSDVIVMETGGMKGQRREMVRAELHEILKKQFKKDLIHSEYGMTELLSQAYSQGEGIFQTPPWMEIYVRDPYDPFHVSKTGKGALNIVDLANVHSCSFIATQDLGEKFEDGSFQVLGRFDQSDIRGCNLMMV